MRHPTWRSALIGSALAGLTAALPSPPVALLSSFGAFGPGTQGTRALGRESAGFWRSPLPPGSLSSAYSDSDPARAAWLAL